MLVRVYIYKMLSEMASLFCSDSKLDLLVLAEGSRKANMVLFFEYTGENW